MYSKPAPPLSRLWPTASVLHHKRSRRRKQTTNHMTPFRFLERKKSAFKRKKEKHSLQVEVYISSFKKTSPQTNYTCDENQFSNLFRGPTLIDLMWSLSLQEGWSKFCGCSSTNTPAKRQIYQKTSPTIRNCKSKRLGEM